MKKILKALGIAASIYLAADLGCWIGTMCTTESFDYPNSEKAEKWSEFIDLARKFNEKIM